MFWRNFGSRVAVSPGRKARSADQAPADESSRRLSGQSVNKRKKKIPNIFFWTNTKKRANDGDVSADDKRFLKKTDKLISGRIKIIFFSGEK